MPFGKFRGRPIEALPDDYLEWLLGLELREPLASAVRREATRRTAFATGRAATRPDFDIAQQLISAGRQTLAKRHHPDAGGTHGAMIVINRTADWLIDQARGQLA